MLFVYFILHFRMSWIELPLTNGSSLKDIYSGKDISCGPILGGRFVTPIFTLGNEGRLSDIGNHDV